MELKFAHTKNATLKSRRRFLSECLAIGGATLVPVRQADSARHGFATSSSVHRYRRLTLLRWDFEAIPLDSYGMFINLLAGHAINPWLRNWMEGCADNQPSCVEALVEVRSENDNMSLGTLLDFNEWYGHEALDSSNLNGLPKEDELSFDEWMKTFRPVSRDDFLMALPLYNWYRNTGVVLPEVEVTQAPWLDAFLASTRGILLWKHQWLELLRLSGCPGGWSGAERLFRHFLGRRVTAADTLRQLIFPPTGQTAMQVIEERSLADTCFGSPDYLAGEWLNKYYGG